MKQKQRIRWQVFSSDNLKAAPWTKIQKRPRRRKWLGLITLALALTMCGAVVQAQQPAGIHRIGILSHLRVRPFRPGSKHFANGCASLATSKDKTSSFEYRYAEGKRDRLPELAAELVRLKVDVLVTAGAPAARAAKNATATIPIVFAGASDPVGTGIVSSLAQPGGNITGLSLMVPDLDGKRLELLKEAFPKVARVAFLWESGGTRRNLPLTDMEAAAKALGLKLLSLEVRSLDDFEGAFARAKKERAQALITTTGGRINTQQRQVLDFAAKNRLPAIYHYSEFVEAGGLMSYGPDNTDIWPRAADFVDKILKGAKPADLPIEQPKKFEFIINLNAAKQIGLTITPNVLARADRVIR